ncbi:hypothetical protein AADX40_15525 [Aeromonas veronii]|uniref:hypothetical protein n=1 Tax=Aeromonas TaxID=642 RepID=UPI003158D90C
MANNKTLGVGLLLLSMQISAAGFVFDDKAKADDVQETTSSVVGNENYNPTEPPKGSYSPMMDYDPTLTAELTQRPGESDQQYLERTKAYYKKSVTEMHGNLEQLNKTMRDLSPQNVLGKHR